MSIPNTFDAKIWDVVLADAQRRHPGYQVKPKEQNWFMALIGKFSSSFATRFTSTVLKTTYMPQAQIASKNWMTLAHETIHVDDYVAHPILWCSLYFAPQEFVLLAFLAFLAIPYSMLWLLALFAVGFIFAPSPFRTHWERRGYMMTIIACCLKYGENYVTNGEFIAQTVGEFTGGAYLWMDPFASSVEEWVRADIRRGIQIANGTLIDSDYSPMVELIQSVVTQVPTRGIAT